jgi:hemerythrin-like domain-containing protein
MGTTADPPLADATAMTRFHRIFREALEVAPRLVGDAAADDADRAQLVGSYYANILDLLHAHHQAEDVTIFPKMLDRLPEHAEVISGVNAEHEEVLGALDVADQAIASWIADPSTSSRDAAAAALTALQSPLLAHLDHEEKDVVPLIGRSITVAEWGEMSAVAFQRFNGDKPWLAIGLIQEQMLPTENQTMEASMPPPVHDFWVGSGRSMYQDYVAGVRG